MRTMRSIFVLVLGLTAVAYAHAASSSADLPHVHVELVSDASGVAAPGSLHAGLHFKLESGWHVYWKNPGDAGEPPRVDWTLSQGVTAGPLQFPAPKRLPLGPLMDFGYEDEVLFPVTLKVDASVKPGSILHLPAKVVWLVCRESCIPEKTNLTLDVPVVSGKPAPDATTDTLFQRFQAALPKPLPSRFKVGFTATPTSFRLTVETGKRETEATFFPADAGVLDNPAAQKLTATAKGFVLELKKDSGLTTNPTQLRGVLELSAGRAYELLALPGAVQAGAQLPTEPAPVRLPQAPAQTAPVSPAPVSAPAAPSVGLARAVLLAFFGGLLLNLMPCVFPVLFIKGLALVKSGSEERHTLRVHGFVYAAGILASFWILVGALLGLRAAGSVLGWGFQFQSPVFLSLMAGLLFFLGLSLAGQFEIGLSLTSTGGSLAVKQGYTGSFFTGVLAVIVATPCTAPFMGAAIGYALAQTAAVTLAVFTALALGLAAPYVALTLQPAWTRALPKPGAWMEILKQATAVPVFATVIWLAWVLAQAYGAALLAVLLASLLLLAVAGWFLGRWPAQRWAAVVASLIVAGVIALSLLTPSKLAAAPQSGAATHAAWEPWTADAASRYQTQGRPVFVDFTASWCLSCQVNERVALHQPEVQKAFADAHVAQLRADWTQHDDAITQALTQLGRSGVPTYVLYVPGSPSPRLLPEVLTPGVVLDALADLRK
jgi:thiol:disulfide interchange protein